MIAVIYVSTASHKLTTDELDRILDQSRRNNQQGSITGMLLYADGNFIQVVEGESDAIDRLLGRLQQDDRHQDIVVIARYGIRERQFPTWSMRFRRLGAPEPQALGSAFSDLKAPIFNDAAVRRSSLAHRLLEGFRLTNPS